MLIGNRYVQAVIGLLRPLTFLLMLIYMLFGLATVAFSMDIPLGVLLLEHAASIILTAFAIACWYVCGTGINDYIDYKVDAVNIGTHKDRPLMAKHVSRKELRSIAAIAGCLAIFSVVLVGSVPLIGLFVFVTLLNYAYSAKPLQISHRGVLAPILLPLGYVVLPVASMYIITGVGATASLLTALGALYFHFFARILLKDFRDIKGDKKFGKKTVLIQLGRNTVIRLSAVALTVSTYMFLYVFPPLQSLVYHMTFALGIGLYMLYQLGKYNTWKWQRPLIAIYGRMSTLLISLVLVGLIAYSEDLSRWRSQLLASILSFVLVLSVFDILRVAKSSVKR